jgi:hypothetical protein
MAKVTAPTRTSFPYPYCNVCEHPVDSFSSERDEGKGTITLIAQCHGTQDERTLDEHAIAQMDTVAFFGEAAHQFKNGVNIRQALAKGRPDDRTVINRKLRRAIEHGVNLSSKG